MAGPGLFCILVPKTQHPLTPGQPNQVLGHRQAQAGSGESVLRAPCSPCTSWQMPCTCQLATCAPPAPCTWKRAWEPWHKALVLCLPFSKRSKQQGQQQWGPTGRHTRTTQCIRSPSTEGAVGVLWCRQAARSSSTAPTGRGFSHHQWPADCT